MGLVTWKTLNILKHCDTVVYDSLVPEELLQWTKPDCEKIYVGKRYGSHARIQLEINALLVEKAREGKLVLRLKGGDPYVFGRGGEEFIAVQEAGICCEEIPGITSAIAVPAAAGIPVTHRGLSDSVTVVTGTAADKDGHAELNMDFNALARLSGTLVILMGMHHLAQIVTGLLAAGKNRNTPCAIIMDGTTKRQRVLRTVLYELPARAAKQGFTSPAVIVIGAVARLELTAEEKGGGYTEWTEAGKAQMDAAGADDVRVDREVLVGVTGTRHFVDKLSSMLRNRGISALDMGFMEIKPDREALPEFADYGWLVFTSPNGVRVFLDKMKEEQRDLRTLSDNHIAVIGPGTAAALQDAGIYADYMPTVFDTAHLAQGLADRILAEQIEEGTGKRCPAVFLRAKQGSDIMPSIFREKGISYMEYPLYELGVQEQKRNAVLTNQPEYIVFGSAMGARAYFEGLQEKELQNTKSRYVCIGEWCAKEVQKYVQAPFLIAEESSVDAVAECLCREIDSKEIGKGDNDVSI